MSNHKARISKLEKRTRPEPPRDLFTVRKIDYRADIVEGVEAAPGSIPVVLVDLKPREVTHEQP